MISSNHPTGPSDPGYEEIADRRGGGTGYYNVSNMAAARRHHRNGEDEPVDDAVLGVTDMVFYHYADTPEEYEHLNRVECENTKGKNSHVYAGLTKN